MVSFRSLRVWQKSHELVLLVYRATRGFPDAERYGLAGQMRRAAASVPSNLAEGVGRQSQAELARYARIALGSASELDYQVLLARDLGYLPDDVFRDLSERVDHVSRMLSRLIVAAADRPDL